MPEPKSFKDVQYAFAAHIRDPKNNPAPAGIEDRRLNIYRELFYNNVENFISSGFPVIRSIYSDEKWHELVRDFFAHHHCQTPYFLEISEEFLHFLEKGRDGQNDPSFLLELAHYEWVELALTVQEEESISNIDSSGDLMSGVPMASELAWTLSYQYPVHRIGPSFQPTEPADTPTFLVVCRDNQQRISFTELNPATARILEIIKANERKTGYDVLKQVAEELQHPEPQQVIEMGQTILEDFRVKQVLLGCYKP